MVTQQYTIQLSCDRRGCKEQRTGVFFSLPNLSETELLKAYNGIHDFRALHTSEWRFGKDGKLYCSESCEEGL
jgi:hypothetical protein